MTDPIDWNKLSPLAMWRDWVAKSEADWSRNLGEMMKSQPGSAALNRQIEEARVAQRMFAEFAQVSLAMANMPSRSDLEGIDERMGRVEDGLAALSAEVVRLREALGSRAATPAPTRNRRPPPPAPKVSEVDTTKSAPATASSSASASASTTVSAKSKPRSGKQKTRPDPQRVEPKRTR
jgi:hypothetical protein